MTFTRRRLCVTLAVLVASLSFGSTAARAQAPAPRIVAVGDVHGNADGLISILQAAGIIDAKQRWIGGNTILVQTGDIFDRGDHAHQAMDLMMRLEGEARRAGGRVEALLGNHEIVMFVGDYRDVSPATYASFADAKSEARRTRAYDDIVKAARKRGDASVPARDAWMTAHPPGFIEYVATLTPRAKYGRWLRTHKAIVTINNNAFMHAGINHTFQGSLDDVNRTVTSDIAAWDAVKDALVKKKLIPEFATMVETIAAATAELDRIAKEQKPDAAPRQYVDNLKRAVAIEKSSLLADDGPMWFRGFALWKETDEPAFTALMGRLKIGRFVAGHTPMPPMPKRNIMNRWNYRIFQIDTGMLAGDFFKDGRPSALELAGDRITIIYTDSKEVVVAGSGPAK